MRTLALAALLALAPAALAETPWDVAKKSAGKATVGQLEHQVNQRLLEEGRKNQCSFVTDKAELQPGCDQKLRRLANVLIDAKKQLNGAGVQNFKFEVSGHTDTSGSADHNRKLSEDRAAVIAREMVARGVPKNEIIAVGMGSKKPLVKPDDTAAKKAKNRRYELQVRL
jgi:outer membrane protein OmpA-like peptidoglycan-associated protein